MEVASDSDVAVDSPGAQPEYVWLGSEAGSGSFGSVHLAIESTSKEVVAVKCIKLQQVSEYTRQEVYNHRALHHPYVIRFKNSFKTRNHLCIVMEYAAHGTLYNCIRQAGRLAEAYARWFFQQLVVGLDYCHRFGVVHRDLSAHNMLLKKEDGLPLPVLKLCDFGLSRNTRLDLPQLLQHRVGTPAYMAPEVLQDMAGRDEEGADIWSAGVCLFFMLYGELPFEHGLPHQAPVLDKVAALLRSIESATVNGFRLPTNKVCISQDCSNLLSRLLHPIPAARITMPEILTHPWFKFNLPPGLDELNDVCLKTVVGNG